MPEEAIYLQSRSQSLQSGCRFTFFVWEHRFADGLTLDPVAVSFDINHLAAAGQQP